MSRFSSITYKGITSPYIAPLPAIQVQSISPSSNSVNEGSPVTFTVATRNAVDNSTLYWTVNKGTTSSDDYPQGSLAGSIYFTGTQWLATPANSNFTLGSSNFTMEGWFRSSNNTIYGQILGFRGTLNNGYGAVNLINSSGNLVLYSSSNGTSWNIVSGTVVTAITLNTWYHLAVVRDGSNLNIYINGTLSLQVSVSGITFSQTSQPLFIGGDNYLSTPPAVSDAFQGLISNVRFVKDVAVYTGTFQPQTYANLPATQSSYGNISAIAAGQTVLLLNTTVSNNLQDSSIYGYTLTTAGTTSVNGASPITPYGSFSITGNSGSFSITPTADSLTEGSETFTVSVRSDSITGTELIQSSTITINDTSIPPPQVQSIYPNISTVDEGSTVTFDVTTISIPNNTTLYWSINGFGAQPTALDFPAVQDSFTIINNSGSFSITPTADLTTEGAEYFSVSIYNNQYLTGTALITSSTITINDTSQNSTPTIIQSVVGQSSTSTTLTTAALTSIQPNDIILLFLAYEANSTQTLGGLNNLVFGSFTWTLRTGVTTQGAGSANPNKLTAALFWARNTTGTTLTNRAFTASISSQFDDGTIMAVQIRGASTTNAFGVNTLKTATSTASGTTPVISLSTDRANALSIGFWTSAWFVTFAAPTGWTSVTSVLNGAGTYYNYSLCFSKTQTSKQTNVSTSSATTMSNASTGAIAIVDSLVG